MDVLMDFKTTIPDNGQDIVRRTELFDFIDQHFVASNHFLLVSAPAGYGKTTLISEWIRERDDHKAWFLVDETVSSPVSFFRGIITALQKINCEVCKGTENLFKMPGLPGVDAVLSSFINEIKNFNEEIILVIDDFHLIIDEYINRFFKKFIKFIPENIFLIIITREDPQLMLNRYRIDGTMAEIREKDLRFNFAETKELYKNIMSINIDESDIELVQKKSEGWVSGAKLVGLNLQDKDEKDIHHFITNFSGSNYYIIDYLIEEVLQNLEEETRLFLYKTSIVERICPELCNYLTKRVDSYSLLKKLEKRNMFLLPLDSEKKWYRYQQLFRDSLKVNLPSERKKDLHVRAANWFFKTGLFEDAVRQALLGEDYKLAVNSVQAAVPVHLKRGDIKGILNLLESIPDKHLSNSGLLLIMKAWSLFITGQKKNALYYINIINKNPGLIDDNNKGRLLTLTCLMPGVDNDKRCGMAEKALALIDSDDKVFKSNALMSLGQIQATYGKIQQSITSFQEAYQLGREAGQVFIEIMSLINLALKLNQAGQLQEALTLCMQNIDRFKDGHGYLEPLAKLIYIPLGILYYHSGELKKAKEYLIDGIEISVQLQLVHVSWMPKIYYAMTCFELGNNELAYEIINDTLHDTKEYNLKPNYLWAENVKVGFGLRTGVNDTGKERLQGYKEKCSGELSVITVPVFFTYCRMLLDDGRNREVIAELKRVEEYRFDYNDKIRYKVLLAEAFFNCTEKAEAEKYFSEAIKLAHGESYLSPFFEEGKNILPLLNEFEEFAPEMVEKIKTKLQIYTEQKGEKEPNRTDSLDQLIEPLTDREKEIVNQLSEGLSNKEIAEKLFITEGTTKWHLSNIYSKLGVNNRTQAVSKSREYGLVE